MKSRTQKRTEAIARLASSSYDNSKAKRLNTATEAQWQSKKAEAMLHLTSMPTGY